MDRADQVYEAHRRYRRSGEIAWRVDFGGLAKVPVVIDYTCESGHIDSLNEWTVTLEIRNNGARDFADISGYLTGRQREAVFDLIATDLASEP